MIIVDGKNKDVKIKESQWALAEPLFIKWGHDISTNEIHVANLKEITSELSAWGIAWE